MLRTLVILMLATLTHSQQCSPDTCTPTWTDQYAGIWGEALIVSFVSITSPDSYFGCSEDILTEQSVQLVEGLLFAVDVFNQNSGPWTGVPSLAGKLGILVFNDCQNPLHAEQLLIRWVTKQVQLKDDQGRLYDPDKVHMIYLKLLNSLTYLIYLDCLYFSV